MLTLGPEFTAIEKGIQSLGMVMHASELSTWQAETGRLPQVQGQPGFQRERRFEIFKYVKGLCVL